MNKLFKQILCENFIEDYNLVLNIFPISKSQGTQRKRKELVNFFSNNFST